MSTKERPILFTGEMVRAILEGRKTQTRRVVNPQPDPGLTGTGEFIQWCGDPKGLRYVNSFIQCDWWLTSPYGKAGDRLWVRETFLKHGEPPGDMHYRASASSNGADEEWLRSEGCKWKPSIHMPRWASRINLEITGIRVERVQDISGADAEAEGVEWPLTTKDGVKEELIPTIYQTGFQTLWDSINAKRGYSWDFNPWVWVVEFKRIKP